MHFHLILTDDCNLCCRYCRARVFDDEESGGSEPRIVVDPLLPPEVTFDLEVLFDFLRRDPAPVLTFYGGEPLLRPQLIERIIHEAPAERFLIQTNGLLLGDLPPESLRRLSTILVSIDGGEELTDANRGSGTYRKVMENIHMIYSRGYNGDLIARMTVNEATDIFDAVHWLSANPHHSFSAIHWQLDANFSRDFSRRRFSVWARENYNPGIRRLVADWLNYMEERSEVLRWYPFLDPMEDLLLGRVTRLRCGSGYANYSIMTDGHIAPCPVMSGMSEYYVGHIRDADPEGLAEVSVKGECSRCTIFRFCGGRCLFSNITRPWGKEGREAVCDTVKNLHRSLTGALPHVRELIADGIISQADFIHEKFNGCEIIP